MAVCPFNASHHVPRPELQFHITTCQDRKMVEMEKYSWALQQPGQHGNLQLPPVAAMPPSQEDWEAEATVRRSYDPSTKARQSAVLRKVEGATPSQRKEFRAQERVRHDALSSKKVEEERARPSLLPPRRESQVGALRRPTLGGEDWRDTRPLNSLLAAHLGRGGKPPQSCRPQLRRPGSFLAAGSSLDTSEGSHQGESLDTTRWGVGGGFMVMV